MIVNGESYCIGIITYSKRRTYIENLLDDIRVQSDIPVYITINCDYGKPFDEDYRNFILELCRKHKSVYPSFYLKFRGSAKLWNDMIVNASYDNLIIINDDARIHNNFISDFIDYRNEVIKVNEVLKVNDGWACFCVNKNYIKSVGFFNEYYLGIGFEDAEFSKRVKEFPAYTTKDFVDLGTESVSTFPKMENITKQEDKVYSRYNHHLYNSEEIDRTINYRPYEAVYDEKFDVIFGGD